MPAEFRAYWGRIMEWHKEIAAALPARHMDEPGSLRDEIHDELSDHLQCSLKRELLQNEDEQEARIQVLERFGDVKGTARTLWFHAMKFRILSRRLLLGASVLMGTGLIFVCVMAWAHISQLRSAVDAAASSSRIAVEELKPATVLTPVL